MAYPVNHTQNLKIGVIHVGKGVGVPAMERIGAAANADLAIQWSTGNPDLLGAVRAVEYEGHEGYVGNGLVLNRSRRYIETVACEPVLAATMAAIQRAALALGYRLEPGLNPNTGRTWITIAR